MSNQQHPYPEIQLKDVLRVLDKTIKEDNTNKAIIFLGMLSAFTEESQLNITLNAPSSAGKTYLVKEIVKLFPKADCIQFSNATPTAIFYGEDAKNDKERKARIVDLERKILIFMEQPDSKAQEKIRAVLSHDQKECIYNITNRNKEGANRAEKVIIRGYPASIFCSANLSLDEQESTRAIMLSPEMTATKIEQAKQNIAALKADSKAYYKQINEDEERKALKRRVAAIRDMHVDDIKLRNVDSILDQFNALAGKQQARHTRDFTHLLDLIKSVALLNIWHRKEDDGYFANDGDVKEALSLWKDIAETQDSALIPYIKCFYYDIVLPAQRQKIQKEKTLQRMSLTSPRKQHIDESLSRQEINAFYRIRNGHAISDYKLRCNILPALESAGYIEMVPNEKDKRQRLVVPIKGIK